MIGELPGHHVFQPREIVPVECLCEPDAIFYADMAKMIRSQWYFIPDDVSHGSYIFTEHLNTFFRQSDSGKRVHDIVGVQHS